MNTTKLRVKLTRKTVLPLIIGVVVFVLYIFLFNVDIPEIISMTQRANPIILSVAIVVSIGDVFFSALSWRALLSCLKVKISTIRAFLYTWYAIYIDTIIPAENVSGALTRVYLVNKEQNEVRGETVASVVMHGIIGMGLNVGALLISVALLLNTTQMPPIIFNLIASFAAIVTLIIVLILVISWKENLSAKIINSLVKLGDFLTRKRWSQRLVELREDALNADKIFHDSMRKFGHNPSGLVMPTLFLVLNLICGLSVPYLAFLSLHIQVSWAVIFLTPSIIAAVKSIPVGIPFEVGLPEITMIAFYTWMGIPAEVSTTATILSRILTLWLRFGIGFAVQQWVELKY